MNKQFDKWSKDHKVNRPVVKLSSGGGQSVFQGVVNRPYTKETLTKETITKEKSPPQKKEETQHHGEYVELTEAQYETLCKDYGKETADLYISKVDNWYPNRQNPKKNVAKNWPARIRTFLLTDKVEKLGSIRAKFEKDFNII